MYNLKSEIIYVIKKTHQWLEFPCGNDDISIMMGTGATETLLGQDFRQTGYSMESNAGAFSLWGIELRANDDIWNVVLPRHKALKERVIRILGNMSCKEALIGNLYYACAIARLQYWRHKEPLPAAEDLMGQGIYYKKYYNSEDGKGSAEKYVSDYKRYVLQ